MQQSRTKLEIGFKGDKRIVQFQNYNKYQDQFHMWDLFFPSCYLMSFLWGVIVTVETQQVSKKTGMILCLQTNPKIGFGLGHLNQTNSLSQVNAARLT